MAQPARAPQPQAGDLRITVNDDFTCEPQSGEVNNGGNVYFECAPEDGAWIVTSSVNSPSFDGETGNYLVLENGTNGPYIPNGDDFTISYCACAPDSNPLCDPTTPKDTGGNTIQVGDPPEPGSGKK